MPSSAGPATPPAFVVAILALLATTAAGETVWCKAKRAECALSCGNGEIDFRCRDKGSGAKSVSCSCVGGVRFGHSETSPGTPSSWLPAWLGGSVPGGDGAGFRGPVFPFAEPVLATPPGQSPARTMALAFGAAAVVAALLAAIAAVVFLAFHAWRTVRARRSRAFRGPAGAAYKPTPTAAPHHPGLDLEAADHPDAVVLAHAKE